MREKCRRHKSNHNENNNDATIDDRSGQASQGQDGEEGPQGECH